MQRTFETNGEIIEYYCFAFVTQLHNKLYLQYLNTNFYCETTDIKIEPKEKNFQFAQRIKNKRKK